MRSPSEYALVSCLFGPRPSYRDEALMMRHTVLRHGSRRLRDVPHILLVDDQVKESSRMCLVEMGFEIRQVGLVEPPPDYVEGKAGFRYTFTKLLVFEETKQFDKVLYLDLDTRLRGDVYHLFESDTGDFAGAPDAAAGRDFNSGVMLFRPSRFDVRAMLAAASKLENWDHGDQSILNQYFRAANVKVHWLDLKYNQQVDDGTCLIHHKYGSAAGINFPIQELWRPFELLRNHRKVCNNEMPVVVFQSYRGLCEAAFAHKLRGVRALDGTTRRLTSAAAANSRAPSSGVRFATYVASRRDWLRFVLSFGSLIDVDAPMPLCVWTKPALKARVLALIPAGADASTLLDLRDWPAGVSEEHVLFEALREEGCTAVHAFRPGVFFGHVPTDGPDGAAVRVGPKIALADEPDGAYMVAAPSKASWQAANSARKRGAASASAIIRALAPDWKERTLAPSTCLHCLINLFGSDYAEHVIGTMAKQTGREDFRVNVSFVPAVLITRAGKISFDPLGQSLAEEFGMMTRSIWHALDPRAVFKSVAEDFAFTWHYTVSVQGLPNTARGAKLKLWKAIGGDTIAHSIYYKCFLVYIFPWPAMLCLLFGLHAAQTCAIQTTYAWLMFLGKARVVSEKYRYTVMYDGNTQRHRHVRIDFVAQPPCMVWM